MCKTTIPKPYSLKPKELYKATMLNAKLPIAGPKPQTLNPKSYTQARVCVTLL
jgi:hypothetical protein